MITPEELLAQLRAKSAAGAPQLPAQPVQAALPQLPAQPVQAAVPQLPAQPVQAALPQLPAQPVQAALPQLPAQPMQAALPQLPHPVQAALPQLPAQPVQAQPVQPDGGLPAQPFVSMPAPPAKRRPGRPPKNATAAPVAVAPIAAVAQPVQPAQSGQPTPVIEGCRIGTLYVNCYPMGGDPCSLAGDLFSEAKKIIKTELGLDHYKLGEYGKGPALFCMAIQAIVESKGYNQLYVDSRTPEGADALETLMALSGAVVRGV